MTGGDSTTAIATICQTVPGKHRGERPGSSHKEAHAARGPVQRQKGSQEFQDSFFLKTSEEPQRAISGDIWMHQLNTPPPGDTDSVSLEPDAACGAAGGGGPTAHTGERSASTLKATRQGPRGWESTGHDSLTEETHTSKLSCGFS